MINVDTQTDSKPIAIPDVNGTVTVAFTVTDTVTDVNDTVKETDATSNTNAKLHLHHKLSAVATSPRAAVKSAIHTTKHVLHRTETVVQTHVLCSPIRCILRFPREWPRVSAFVFAVVMPLWILIGVAMGFGTLLAQYESPVEIEANDAILAARAQIAHFDVSAANVLSATRQCLDAWEQSLTGNETAVAALFNSTLADILLDDGDPFVWINRTILDVPIDQCTGSFLPQLDKLQQVTRNHSEAFNSLRFNWNRCWDEELLGNSNLVFYPTDDQKLAAKPDAQEEHFTMVWKEMQQELYQKYLPPNATEEEDYQAFLLSIDEATGDSGCTVNAGGTAWFFFTIMTTVGYGNQAPVTDEGRLLIVTAGLFSIVLFGVVLGLCGYVLLAIFDDFVGRHSCAQWLAHPVVAVFLWGTIWLVYALAIAADVDYWWEERLPEFAADVYPSDALWFAFISTSTIGLGDYYLQPELIFASDTLKYSVLFLVGFVFLSTFFGKIAECLNLLLPKKHNSLPARLAATRVLACWPRGFMPWEKTPDNADGASDILPDDQALIYRIQQVKALKPDPPTGSEDLGEPNRGVVSSLTGNPKLSRNVELLKQEEALLQEWLEIIQQQQQRALQPLDMKGQPRETLEEQSVHAANGDSPLGSINEKHVGDQTGSTGNSSEEEATLIVQREPPKETNVILQRQQQSPPAPLLPPIQDDDISTVVSPAEESFNPLASFFRST